MGNNSKLVVKEKERKIFFDCSNTSEKKRTVKVSYP